VSGLITAVIRNGKYVELGEFPVTGTIVVFGG
jgi:hypothetical protein